MQSKSILILTKGTVRTIHCFDGFKCIIKNPFGSRNSLDKWITGELDFLNLQDAQITGGPVVYDGPNHQCSREQRDDAPVFWEHSVTNVEQINASCHWGRCTPPPCKS